MKNISVLIPTTGIRSGLDSLLGSIEDADLSGVSLDVWVLANGKDAAAISRKAKAGGWRFPLHYRIIETPGKNVALNVGWGESRGELLVCFDDDVVVAHDYFQQLLAGLVRWPEASAFGGKVKIRWPLNYLECIDERVLNYVKAFAFAELDIDGKQEGLFDPLSYLSPLGNNMVFRREMIDSNLPFDEDCGPKGRSYRMGGATPLFKSLYRMNKQVVYLPEVVVWHCIHPEQLSMDWVLNRAYMWGRSVGHFGHVYRRHDARESIATLCLRWAMYSLREVVFRFKKERFPRYWAAIDRRIVEGILYEKHQRSTQP